MMATKTKILQFVRDARAGKLTPKDKLKLGNVTSSEVARIKSATGKDLSGYVHILDMSGIIHTFNNHGNPEVESKRGQIAITAADFVLIPQIIKKGNLVYEGDKKSRPTLLYALEVGQKTIYVEEIRTGKKELCIKSMRKFPKKRATR